MGHATVCAELSTILSDYILLFKEHISFNQRNFRGGSVHCIFPITKMQSKVMLSKSKFEYHVRPFAFHVFCLLVA